MTHLNRLLIFVLVLFSLHSTYGQQDIQSTIYMYNQNVLNPAYAGSRDVLSANILGRTQWVGLDGAPNTAAFNIHAPVGKSVGLGLSVVHDEIGPVQESNVFADVSYTIQTTDHARLAFGLKAGITMQNIDRNLVSVDFDSHLQEILNLGNQVFPNFGFGAFYYGETYYVGVSVPNLLETRYFEKSSGEIEQAYERRHYFATSGVVFKLSDNVKLKPSTMLKVAHGTPLSVDLTVNALFHEVFELGVSYRLDDSISGLMVVNISSDFRMGYAYDYTLTNLGDYNSGSHEIMLLYDFHRKRVKSPRFF